MPNTALLIRMLRQLRCKCSQKKKRSQSDDPCIKAANRVISRIQCPCCGRCGHWIRWGFYERTITEPDPFKAGPGTRTRVVRVQRLRCKCSHTHALLDTGIVPYRRFSLLFIDNTVGRWRKGRSVSSLCEILGIGISTLYRWTQLYIRDLMAALVPSLHYAAWMTAGERKFSLRFQQDFMLRNSRLFLENLRPVRPCASTPSSGWSRNSEYLTWPRIR